MYHLYKVVLGTFKEVKTRVGYFDMWSKSNETLCSAMEIKQVLLWLNP